MKLSPYWTHAPSDPELMLFPLLVAIPLPCVLFGLVWLWLCCFLFVCFVSLFLVVFFVCFFAGRARWTAHRSTTSTFVAIDNRQPCMLITIQLLLRLNVCHDLTEAMKALDGKKSLVSPELRCQGLHSPWSTPFHSYSCLLVSWFALFASSLSVFSLVCSLWSDWIPFLGGDSARGCGCLPAGAAVACGAPPPAARPVPWIWW